MTPNRTPAAQRFHVASRFIGDLVQYGFASAAAFALDYALLIVSSETLGLPYLAATALGFSAGLALVYWLSVAIVFRDRRSVAPVAEFGVFCAIGLGGLAITEALIFVLVGQLGVSLAIAKLPTAGCVFLFNFVARRALLFSAPAAKAA